MSSDKGTLSLGLHIWYNRSGWLLGLVTQKRRPWEGAAMIDTAMVLDS